MTEQRHGMVQVYTGDGKGKTTAALGLALRASGQGLKVYIIQFMKGWPFYGELESVKHLPGVTMRQFGRPDFVSKENPDPQDVRGAQEALEHAREVVVSGKYDLVILDEINVALEFGLVPLANVMSLLDQRPPQVELVLTGRWAPGALIARADLVTEMLAIKHPYNDGVQAHKGIEF